MWHAGGCGGHLRGAPARVQRGPGGQVGTAGVSSVLLVITAVPGRDSRKAPSSWALSF